MSIRSLAIGSLPPDLSQQAEQLVAEFGCGEDVRQPAQASGPVDGPAEKDLDAHAEQVPSTEYSVPSTNHEMTASSLPSSPPTHHSPTANFPHVEPAALADKLAALGFSESSSWGPAELNPRYLANRSDGLHLGATPGRLMLARI